MTASTPGNADLALVRWGLAAIFASAGYLLAVVLDFPLFNYYPMVGQWFWSAPAGGLAESLGPRIAFFGWKGTGFLLGLVAWLIPARLLSRLPNSIGLGGVILVTVTMLIHESRWFLL